MQKRGIDIEADFLRQYKGGSAARNEYQRKYKQVNTKSSVVTHILVVESQSWV